MSRDYSLYLRDILESREKIREYLGQMTFDEFLIDRKTVDSVVRNLEIIGEAVKCLPDELLASQPQVVWKDVARFRDIIAHYYFKVDYEVVWSITQEDLDPLVVGVSALLDEIREDKSD